jgi:hypothetical protein
MTATEWEMRDLYELKASELQADLLSRKYDRDGEDEEGKDESLDDAGPAKIEVRFKECDSERAQKKVPEIG